MHCLWYHGHNFLMTVPFSFWLFVLPRSSLQYEISMPVHPPPLPSQQTPILLQQPELQEQPLFQLINLIPTRQVQLQQYDMQPPFQQKPFLLPEGNQPVVQQQPSERQPQQVSFINRWHLSPKTTSTGFRDSSAWKLSSTHPQMIGSFSYQRPVSEFLEDFSSIEFQISIQNTAVKASSLNCKLGLRPVFAFFIHFASLSLMSLNVFLIDTVTRYTRILRDIRSGSQYRILFHIALKN